MSLSILTTGGTIDKIYFDAKSEFHIGDSEIPEFLEIAGVRVPSRFTRSCAKTAWKWTTPIGPWSANGSWPSLRRAS